MKSKVRKICQGLGFAMLLFTAGLGETENAAYIFLWLGISIALLYAGKSFSFQQK